MSWTQVYVSGLAQTEEPSDEELENQLVEQYKITCTGINNSSCNSSSTGADENNGDLPCSITSWAGPGTTLVKRDPATNACRGYAFVAFLSLESAQAMVERINKSTTTTNINTHTHTQNTQVLRAELSKPKVKQGKKQKGSNHNGDLSDIRLRRKRAQPVRKHPVIISSDRKKTGLGNKTK